METIRLNIDGHDIETEKGKTVLEAALDTGIYIPHICHHPDLASVGECRLCVVEIEGMPGLTTSCTTQASEGMVVKTKTPDVDRIRRLSMELMMTVHPTDCMSCPKYLNCELQSLRQYLGVEATRFRRRQKHIPVNRDNPLFLHDLDRCILCGRCVRACYDMRGAGVLSFINRGSELSIGTAFDRSLADAGCRFCGACAEVCPTGTIRDYDELVGGGKSRRVSLIPCRYTCPAGIDVPRYIRFIREGKYPEAAAVIRERVPFPAVLGYVCNHPCEAACRRGELNEAISIKDLKRFAAERDTGLWKEGSEKAPPTGKQVAVVGSGPAGLTAAYHLNKLGHSVTVFEALPLAGGMMRVGIPAYRLPEDILDKEISDIESCGVEIRTDTKVESLDALFEDGCDAVLVAIGTHEGQVLPIPGADLDGVLVSLPFLRDINLGNAVKVGERVLVLGGGNVAFDCARTALRLGAAEAAVACLEAEDGMPATPDEIALGEEEGVTVYNSRSFSRIVGEDRRVSGVECLHVQSFEFDDDGDLSVETVESSEHIIPADTVIFAVGQRPEMPAQFGLETGRGDTISVDEYTHTTDRDGVFATGDAVNGTSSVVEAIASGREIAGVIDGYLGGSGNIDEVPAPAAEPPAWLGSIEDFAGQPRRQAPCPPAAERLGSFDEQTKSFEEEAALEESRRCLQCDLRLRISTVKFWADYTPP